MTSQQRRAATNRQNAQASTGPTTEAGKESSKMNATKHGLTARNAILPTDNPSDYEVHKTNWINSLKPNSFEESHLAQIIVDTHWRLQRIPRIEEMLMAENLESLKLIKALDNLSRHESRLRKIVGESMKQLQGLQEARRIQMEQMELTAQEKPGGFVLQRGKGASECRVQTPEQAINQAPTTHGNDETVGQTEVGEAQAA